VFHSEIQSSHATPAVLGTKMLNYGGNKVIELHKIGDYYPME